MFYMRGIKEQKLEAGKLPEPAGERGETKNIQFYTGLDVTEKETVIVRFE